MHLPFLAALERGLPDNGILVTDSTQPAYVAHHSWPGRSPRAYITAGGFGTLGPALPMAIGAQLAAPGRPVAALAGDGGALFTIQELASAADLGLPIALVIWQNDGYNEMRESMDRIGAPHLGTEISSRDFVKLAEGFGCRGVRTGTLDDVPGALAEAFAADRPRSSRCAGNFRAALSQPSSASKRASSSNGPIAARRSCSGASSSSRDARDVVGGDGVEPGEHLGDLARLALENRARAARSATIERGSSQAEHEPALEQVAGLGELVVGHALGRRCAAARPRSSRRPRRRA